MGGKSIYVVNSTSRSGGCATKFYNFLEGSFPRWSTSTVGTYVHNSKLSIYSVRTGEERVGEVKSAEDVKGKFSKKRKNDKNGKKGKKMKLK